MEGHIRIGRAGARVLLLGLLLLGALLATGVSASAKTAPELTLSAQTVGAPGMALSPSIAYARAIQAPAAPGEVREAISITSATPSVCVALGYVWGPGEELPPEREMDAEAWVYGDGTCTLVASVQVTSTTEAAEVSKSFTAGGPPLSQAPKQPTLPEISFEPPGQAYLGAGSLATEAKSTRPGLSVSSSTPAVCTVSPSQANHLGVVADFVTTGTCTLSASLPKTAEHEAVVVTKSILIARVGLTSTPPSSAVAGGSYEVTASSAPGLPVELRSEGAACTFTKPRVEQSLPAAPHSEPAPRGPDAPATVYFLRPGTCTITAEGNSALERVSQSFAVAPGPPEQITFTSTAPSNAVVGGSYSPTVRSSLGWPVSFSIATPSVCKIVLGSSSSLTEVINGVTLAPSAVHFIGAGTCTIEVRPQEGSAVEGLEAQESFSVQAAPVPTLAPTSVPAAPTTAGGSTPAPTSIVPPSATAGVSTPAGTSVLRTPTSFKLVGHPSVEHRSATIKLKASCSGPGTLSWRVTFKGKRGVIAAGVRVFATGAMKITRASTPILTVKPTRAALRTLEREKGHVLSVKALLTFEPASEGSPVSLERSIVVRLA